MTKQDKFEALSFGKIAEEAVAHEYIKTGYVILEQNWRLGKTEIDLIAQKEDQIIFIEVKARTGENSDPVEAVTRDKRKRMIRAADAYLKTLTGDYSYRLDIASVIMHLDGQMTLDILEDAFLSADLF